MWTNYYSILSSTTNQGLEMITEAGFVVLWYALLHAQIFKVLSYKNILLLSTSVFFIFCLQRCSFSLLSLDFFCSSTALHGPLAFMRNLKFLQTCSIQRWIWTTSEAIGFTDPLSSCCTLFFLSFNRTFSQFSFPFLMLFFFF